MADTPDIRPSQWPEPPVRAAPSALTPVRPIGDRVSRFGVARELDAAQRTAPNDSPGATSPWPALPVAPPAVAKEGTWARVGTWWACREVHPVDVWHRLRCHFGRHQIQGGQRIQLGGRFVNTERCCVWCGCPPR